jgi:hypothetical protein
VLIVVSFLIWFQIPGGFIAFVFFVAMGFSWTVLQNTRKLFKIGQNIIDIKTGRIQSLLDGIDLKHDEEQDEAVELEKGTVEQAEELEKGNEEQAEAQETKNADRDRGESWKADEKVTVNRLLPPDAKSMREWNKIGAIPSEAVYMVAEYVRINEATETFCWVMFGLELFAFYFYPLITLVLINWNLAVLFVVCATISAIRHYMNIAVVIEEYGNMDLVGGDTIEKKWESKSRLNTIVDGITQGKSRNVWLSILGGCGFVFMAIFLTAVGSSTEATDTATLTYLPNFSYPGLKDDMRYPTCTLSNIQGGFGANSTLLDFAFMSSIAYLVDDNTQETLDGWFGPSGTEAVFDKEYVENFREENDPDDLPVFFKLFRFPQLRLGMIVIRGTSNNWDMVRLGMFWVSVDVHPVSPTVLSQLADSQLWSAAALMQGLRAILPAGEIWTPIMDRKCI